MKIYILDFIWYMGIDGSGSYPLGVYSSSEKATEAMERYLAEHELANEPYNHERLEINEYVLDEDDFQQ